MQSKLSVDALQPRTAAIMLAIFLIGIEAVFAPPSSGGADVWLSYLLSFVLFIPVLFVWGQLMKKFPGQDLFSILETVFGKGFGRIIAFLYFLFFLFLASSVRFYYASFTQMASLTHTPLVVTIFLFFLLSAHLAKSGAQTIGKWSVFLAVIVLGAFVCLSLLAIPILRTEYLFPLVETPGGQVLEEAFGRSVLQLSGGVVFLALLGRLDPKASPQRVLFLGTGIAVLFGAATVLRDTAILGQGGFFATAFPSFKAVGVITLGTTGMGVEVIELLLSILTGLTSVSLFLLGASRALTPMFGLKEEAPLVLSIAFFTVPLAFVLFSNLTALAHFAPLFLRFAPVFSMGIPLVLWIFSGIGKRK